MSPEADLSILELLLLFSPVAAFCWWMGYIATKRMRLEKNKEREPAIQRALDKKEQRERDQQPDRSNTESDENKNV